MLHSLHTESQKLIQIYIMHTFMIDENGTLKSTEHDKYENIASSVWLSLFIGNKCNNGNAYYCPRCLAPGLAQLNIYTNNYTNKKDQQYNFEPSQTTVCIWRWTWNLQCGIYYNSTLVCDSWKILSFNNSISVFAPYHRQTWVVFTFHLQMRLISSKIVT
jgi:hypothetical protein